MIRFLWNFTKTLLGPTYLLQSIYQSHTTSVCVLSYLNPSKIPRFAQFGILKIIYLSESMSDYNEYGIKLTVVVRKTIKNTFVDFASRICVTSPTKPLLIACYFHPREGGSLYKSAVMTPFTPNSLNKYLEHAHLLQSIYQPHCSTMCTVSYTKPSEITRFFTSNYSSYFGRSNFHAAEQRNNCVMCTELHGICHKIPTPETKTYTVRIGFKCA